MRSPLLRHGFLTLCAAGLLSMVTSCRQSGSRPGGSLPPTSPVAVSTSQSEYGDRPGIRGFRTVILDAGHGGHDSGATSRSTGAQEKNLALTIAQKTAAILRSSHQVVLLRQGDQFIDLDDRVAFANRYQNAILVSIHLNHSGSGVSGAETYWWRTDSYSLATRLQRQLAMVAGDNGRGMVRRRLRLTRNPSIPCVLVECGYLSNASDAAHLNNPAHQDRLAAAIARAIQETSSYGDQGMGTLPQPIFAPPSRPTDPPNS